MASPSVETVVSNGARLSPLVLDVDDALLRTDLLHETAVAYVKTNPLRIFDILFWLVKGKAILKRKLSERVLLDVDRLPVNQDLAAFAQQAHDSGRLVGIATAADELLARRIARRFDFVQFVVASDGSTNLKGPLKAMALGERFPQGFTYAGDSPADLAVWSAASSIVLANASGRTTTKARRLGRPIEAEFRDAPLGWRGWAKALRVHQWAKNALVLAPLVLAGMVGQPAALASAAVALVAMSLMASGTYLINDIFDLAADRAHWSKRHRALASGALPIRRGVPLAMVLIAGSLGAGAWLGPASLAVLATYMATTLGYSFYLKRQPIVDAFALATLFTLRLGLGIAAVGCVASPWLLVFSMFLFSSLAFAKRQTEIQKSVANGNAAVASRGYLASDAGLVLALGIATAMGAITIMVLYVMNDVYSAEIYRQPLLLWVFPAALYMWLSRIWLLCHREQLHDDPVAFAIRDRMSIGLGGLMAAALLGGWLL